jgi:glycosyltransferase involved in cell wall biosynthesis
MQKVRPKIVFIAGTYQPQRCGVAHYTARLRNALAQHQVTTEVLTTQAAAQSVQDASVIGALQNWRLSELQALVRAVCRSNADILHIQHAAGTYGFDRSIFLFPLLLRASGWRRPIVTTVHEYGWWEWQPQGIPPAWLEALKQWGQKRGWWDREDGFLLTQSHAILTTNHEAEAALFDRLPHLKSRVHRIPIAANVGVTPIDRSKARQQLRRHCGWAQATIIVAFFGFLHPVKGLETLLSAFQQVHQYQPQARLLLVGGVETLALPGEQATRYWQQLHTKVAELGLTSIVHMTGYLATETASRYLSGADIGVLPFHHGVTLKSGSLLTLLSHHLPVIATHIETSDAELNPEIIQPIPPRHVNELASAMLALISDPARCQQLAEAGYSFSCQFSWQAITAAHWQVYQSVLQTSKSALQPLSGVAKESHR